VLVLVCSLVSPSTGRVQAQGDRPKSRGAGCSLDRRDLAARGYTCVNTVYYERKLSRIFEEQHHRHFTDDQIFSMITHVWLSVLVPFELAFDNPQIGFFDDDPFRMNAVALRPSGSARGTILMGRWLTAFEYDPDHRSDPTHRIRGIFAHEAAHLLQYKKRLEFPSTRLRELHADYLAGWYVGRVNRNPREDNKLDEIQIFNGFYRRGDDDFDNPDHHGSRTERLKAFLEGFEDRSDSAIDAAQLGQRYVYRIGQRGGSTE
jgi:hypothetical protein